MQKWEYYVEPEQQPQDAKAQLNKLGEDGWELVQIIDHYYYLKREKDEQRKAPEVKEYAR